MCISIWKILRDFGFKGLMSFYCYPSAKMRKEIYMYNRTAERCMHYENAREEKILEPETTVLKTGQTNNTCIFNRNQAILQLCF